MMFTRSGGIYTTLTGSAIVTVVPDILGRLQRSGLIDDGLTDCKEMIKEAMAGNITNTRISKAGHHQTS